jgi:hypothetical protein
MSTAAVSVNLNQTNYTSYLQSRQSDLQQLGQDLQAGDLTDAQTEYSDIQNLAQSGPFGGDPSRSATARRISQRWVRHCSRATWPGRRAHSRHWRIRSAILRRFRRAVEAVRRAQAARPRPVRPQPPLAQAVGLRSC